tara:strand:+ start:7677 stop:9128 length:1452 start_codon:yes stop_codon:yes gene_type:complete
MISSCTQEQSFGFDRLVGFMTYDVIIIGSGPGGYVAAIRAAQYGCKVAVVERAAAFGGTCLHVGCIPTKALLHFADSYETVVNGKHIGINTKEVTLDFSLMQQRKRQIIEGHARGIQLLFRKNKIESIAGFGRLMGDGRVEVESTDERHELKADNIVLATGSEAKRLPGINLPSGCLLTNVEILNLETIPKSLAIVGAGAVGVEFASIYRSFGSDVTILEALPRLVPLEDEEISKELARAFLRRNIQIHTGAVIDSVEQASDGVAINFTAEGNDAQQMSAEKVLLAVGRTPNTEKIGLENTSIQTEKGFIKTDSYMQTAEQGVYAIGDIVADTPQLAHVASMEGIVAATRIAGQDVEPINRHHSPAATYCEPQIGSVGFTEAVARKMGYAVKVGKFSFRGNSKSSILGRHDGFVKVIAEEETEEILGVHIIGPQATELISEAVVAMSSEATADSIARTIHSHPTLSEAVQEAFQGVYGMTINS